VHETESIPASDEFVRVQYLENQMAVALGGRIAEELIFGEDDITTGAGGDFQQVTRTARMMVEQMGFSKALGQVAWGGSSGPAFLGQSAGRGSDFSQATADRIDQEVRTAASTNGYTLQGNPFRTFPKIVKS
jgi:ATP-dependent Zn protease